MADPALPPQLALHVDRLLQNGVRSIEDLTSEQINHRPAPDANSIGWDVWHLVRTVDNVVCFVFHRERPVWLQQGFDQRFGLPRVAQGTGMPDEEARALVLPAATEFCEYIEAVRAAVVPRIRAMTPEDLAEAVELRPWGVLPKVEHIAHVLIAHGNGHLGRVSLARTLIGKDDLGI